jgi:hypothetical protein
MSPAKATPSPPLFRAAPTQRPYSEGRSTMCVWWQTSRFVSPRMASINPRKSYRLVSYSKTASCFNSFERELSAAALVMGAPIAVMSGTTRSFATAATSPPDAMPAPTAASNPRQVKQRGTLLPHAMGDGHTPVMGTDGDGVPRVVGHYSHEAKWALRKVLRRKQGDKKKRM